MFSFCKMQATGNDFVVINYLKNKFEYSYKLLSEYLCNRHYGVGADGILIVEESKMADFKMRIFNTDGSEAEMCGNGIRCFAKYVYEENLIDKLEFDIETLAGIKSVKLKVEGNTVVEIEVDMGKAEFDLEKIPVWYQGDEYNGLLHIEDMKIYPISMGNPHAVCIIEDINKIDISKYGKLIENYKYFPNKTNVEFVQIIDESNIKLRVWERGVGETLSCGTGACAAVAVLNKLKYTSSRVTVDLLGGKLKIISDETIKLIGNAEKVFEGNILI